ncbi:hypothetical protein JXO52_00385 [bacterium]|nr:hypothetical protein [bacterium]
MSAEKQKRNPGRKRRGLRLLAGMLVGLPVLILLLFSIIALLPSRKAGAWLSAQLSAAAGVTVRLDEVSVNPFGSVRVRNAAMLTPAGDTLAAVRGARIDYRFLPLFSRTIAVRRVEIDRPVVHLPFPADSAAVKQRGDSTGVRPSGEAAPLPFSLGLWSFDLRNFAFSLVLPEGGPLLTAGVSGIGLEVENAYLPRGTLAAGSPSHGRMHLFSDRGTVTLTDSTGRHKRALRLDLRLEKEAEGDWLTALDAGLGTERDTALVRLMIAARGSLPAGTAVLKRCDLLLGGTALLQVTGTGALTEGPARLDLSLSGRPLALRPAAGRLLPLLPPALADISLGDLPDVTLQLLPGTITGTVDSLALSAAITADLPAFSPDSATHMSGIRLHVSAAATAAGGMLRSVTVNAGAGLKKVILILPDSTLLTAGPLALTAGVRVDSSLLPVSGSIEASLDSVLSGRLGLSVRWTVPGARLHDVRLAAGLRADSLALGAIPSLPETVSGRVNATLHLQAAGLDSIGAELAVQTERIDYVLADRAEHTGPLTISAALTAAALDTLFQRWRIDTLTADLNRIALLAAAGSLDGAAGTVDIPSWRLTIDNGLIIPALPAGMRDRMQYVAISGEETAEGSLRMSGAVLETRGRLSTGNVSLKDADTGISLDEIALMVSWQGAADSLNGSLGLGLHHIALPGYLDDPLDTVRIGTGFALSGGAVTVEGGTFDAPGLKISGGFRAIIDSARGAGQLAAEGGIRFQSPTPVRFPGGLQGSGDISMKFGCVSLDSLGGRLELSGEIGASACDLGLDTLISLKGLDTRLPFRAVMDMREGGILTDAAYRPIQWEEYDQRRTLYRELMPEIGTVTITSALIAGQRLHGAELDIKIDNGWCEVPRFYVNTLSGNVGGKLRVNFGVKPPAPLLYEIEAQAARINAASFVEDARAAGEATELNAVMRFTGQGIDPAAGIDLQGFFNITKIGPRFASTLLEGLDPQGRDRTIRLTRRLLNTGWKPSLFSFEARHGYVYPSLSLVQPWFSPIRLPETMEFGRLPLEFFLKPAQQPE